MRSDARKRQPTTPRLYVANFDEATYIWEQQPDNLPRIVLASHDVRDDALWAGIVAMVEGGGVK